MTDSKYFKEYRKELGFSSQGGAKSFFGAKDIVPAVDFNYLKPLNQRLHEIVAKIDSIAHQSVKIDDLESFCSQNINVAFEIIKKNDHLRKLTNQGRRPEEVYFSWMRGFVICNYFLKPISKIFDIKLSSIKKIGDDNFKQLDTFKRTPTADLEFRLKNKEKIRIEVQSGFQGINDIKHHKVLEAKEKSKDMQTIVMHFDLFNGQVAFVRLDTIDGNDLNWITRQQMEGQTVFNIDQNYFSWKLLDPPPKWDDIKP